MVYGKKCTTHTTLVEGFHRAPFRKLSIRSRTYPTVPLLQDQEKNSYNHENSIESNTFTQARKLDGECAHTALWRALELYRQFPPCSPAEHTGSDARQSSQHSCPASSATSSERQSRENVTAPVSIEEEQSSFARPFLQCGG